MKHGDNTTLNGEGLVNIPHRMYTDYIICCLNLKYGSETWNLRNQDRDLLGAAYGISEVNAF